MSIVAWLSLGLLAGFVAGKLSCGTGRGVLLEVAFGTVLRRSGEFSVQCPGECSCPKPWRMQADRCRNRRKHGLVHRSRLGPAPVALVLRPLLSHPICTAGRQGARGGVRSSYTGHVGDFHGFGICRFDTLPELSGQGVAGTARNCACWPGAFPCRQGRGCPRNAARAASAGCSAHAGGRHAGRAAAPSFPGQREREAGSQACVGVWTEPARACPARSGGRCRTRSCLRGQSRRVPPWRRRRAAGTACCWPGSPAPRKPPSCPRDVGARAGNRRPVPRAGLDCSGRFPDGARTD